MKRIFVTGKELQLAGVANLIVQGEKNAEELRFVFVRHQELRNLDIYLNFQNAEGEGSTIGPLSKEDEGENWYASWYPAPPFTNLGGKTLISLSACRGSEVIWNTVICPIYIAKRLDPEHIDPAGNPTWLELAQDAAYRAEQAKEIVESYRTRIVDKYTDLPAIGVEGVHYIVLEDTRSEYIFNNGSIEDEPIGYMKLNDWDVIQCRI